MRQTTTATWVGILILFFTTMVAGDEDVNNRRPVPQTGEIASMEELLSKVRADFSGNILEVELDSEDDDATWVYEVKILQENGSVSEIEYDATSLNILDVEQGDDWHKWFNKDD